MTKFRFLHAADIHLDSPLRGLSRYEGVPVDQVREATRTALDNLIELAIARGVAFVVIAGDLYDGRWDDMATGLYFCRAMRRLNDAGIEAYIALGNHDAASQQTLRLPLPGNVHLFSHKASETFIHAATGTALHGQSYDRPDTREDLSAAYPAAVAEALNIGVLHTALTGRPPHDDYAPAHPEGLAAKGYHYWALGHVHAHEIVSIDPYIVFPGNLQGRHIRECGPKGAVLVAVEDGLVAGLEHVALDAVRWADVTVEVSGCGSVGAVDARVHQALAEAHRSQAAGRPLIARVTLTGATALHGLLAQRLALLRDEVRVHAANVAEDLWIEKVRLATRPAETVGAQATTPDDLTALLGEGEASAELHAALQSDFALLLSRVPPELGEDSEMIGAARAEALAPVLARAAAALQARLEEWTAE
jgi:exonuclease SbcD